MINTLVKTIHFFIQICGDLLKSDDESSVSLWSTKVEPQVNLAWDYQKGEETGNGVHE